MSMSYNSKELKADLTEGINYIDEIPSSNRPNIPIGIKTKIHRMKDDCPDEEIKKLYKEVDDYYRSEKDQENRKILKALLREPIQKFLSDIPMPTRKDVINELKEKSMHEKQVTRERNIMVSPGARRIQYASISTEIIKLSNILKFAADLNKNDVYGIIEKLSELINRKDMFDEKTLTLTQDGIDHLKGIKNFPINKMDNSIPQIMSLFLRGLDIASKQTPPDKGIVSLRDYLFSRWGTPDRVLKINLLSDIKRKIQLAYTGIAALVKN